MSHGKRSRLNMSFRSFLFIVAACQLFGCKDIVEIVRDEEIYKIECKTPRDEVKTYYLSVGEYEYCYHYQSGIFDFKTVDGLAVKASDCFVEGVPVKQHEIK